MIADFAAQMVDPPRVRCLGVEMKPFSLGHSLLLWRIRNRFATRETPAFEDLVSAAFICAHSWEENQKLLRSPFRRWLTLKIWGLMAGKFDVAENIVSMQAYLNEANRIPEQRKGRGGTRELFADWYTRLFNYLRFIGYDDSQILNMPIARANLMFCAWLEHEEAATFKSRSAIAREDLMTRILEQEEAKEKGFPA